MNQEERIALGQKVRKYRKDKGLSIEAIAEGICHPSTLSQLERGKFIPNGTILKQVCDKLGIATNDLFEEHSEKLEVDALLDIIKIHIQRGEFESAFQLIEILKNRPDLAKYQKNTLTLCEADYLLKTHEAHLAIKKLQDFYIALEQDNETDKQFLATVLNKLGNACYRTANMVDAYSHYLSAYTVIHLLPFDTLSAKICYNLGNT